MIKTVAVGTDGSETADKAVEFALDLAEKFGAKVVIAQLVHARSARTRSGATSARRPRTSSGRSTRPRRWTPPCARPPSGPASAGIEAVSEAREGEPADVLCDIAEAHGADVIVVGNRGMQRRVLGSVPNSVSHKAPCSVVIVKTT